MSCCAHASAASRFFSFFARRYRKRYLKKGLEATQKQLVEGVLQAGIDGASLLEIGCGVGYLHQHLLSRGAAYAVGIDLSDKMLQEAAILASEQGMIERTEYLLGDFLDLAPQIAPSEITLLDKVVCCYPDAEGLVKQSLAKTQRVYALTYPRNRWTVRLGMVLGTLLMWLLRSEFRSFVHDPQQIEAWITAEGFRKQYQNQTWMWLTQVYVRAT